MRIDPHTHTNISDGTDTPTQLMRKAAHAKLDMIGLVDHDTIAGWDEASRNVTTTGVALIRGAEISSAVNDITVHMLAYLFNPHDEQIQRIFTAEHENRKKRAQRMVEKLQVDFDIEWDDVHRQAPNGGPIGRPHIADALIARGYFPNRAAVFEHTLHPKGPYYIFDKSIDARDLVRIIREAGGVPVLAHPRAAKRQRLISDDSIREMAQAGLFGIERDHRDHDDAGKESVHRLAAECGLRLFGASDYHGLGKPNALGENLTDPAVIAALEEQAHLEVLRP